MEYKLNFKFIYRKRDKIIIIAFLFFLTFVLIAKILSLSIVFMVIFGLFFLYRIAFISFLKMNTKLFLDDEKIIFDSPLIKKTIYLNEIMVLAFSRKKLETGDLILNLNGLRILNQYWNNLVIDAYGYSDISKVESILIPDILEVEKFFHDILLKLEFKYSGIEKIKSKNYDIIINDKNFVIRDENSEIIYFDKKRMIRNEREIKIKVNDPSLNDKTFELEDIPPLKFIKDKY